MSKITRVDSSIWCRYTAKQYEGSNTALIYYVGKVGTAAVPRSEKGRLSGNAIAIAESLTTSGESDPRRVLQVVRGQFPVSLPGVIGAVAVVRSCPRRHHGGGEITEADSGYTEIVSRHVWVPAGKDHRFHGRKGIDPACLELGSDGIGFMRPLGESSDAALWPHVGVVSLPVAEDEQQLVTRIDAVPMAGSFGDRNAVYALVHVIETPEGDKTLERIHPFDLVPGDLQTRPAGQQPGY